MKKAVIVYWSKTGNTEKTALAIKEGLEEVEVKVSLKRVEEAEDIDFYDYDLVCIGCPSYQWHPPKPVVDYLISKFANYRNQGKVKKSAPKIAGKNAIIFCTYSGPHTGLNEATPVGKYVGQFFEHLGFNIFSELYILSEFHGSLENSTKGKMGDIRGRPNEEDLKELKEKAKDLAKRL